LRLKAREVKGDLLEFVSEKHGDAALSVDGAQAFRPGLHSHPLHQRSHIICFLAGVLAGIDVFSRVNVAQSIRDKCSAAFSFTK
jgi:hypothetical protein